jgi:hypothetical protein
MEMIMTGRQWLLASLAFASVCCLFPQGAFAQGELSKSWKTAGGWLTELRVHPNGAKVCSTGKASQTPHTFALTFVRSGREAAVLVVDQNEPPASQASGEMTFRQAGKTVGKIRVQAEGPAFASTDPNGSQARNLIARLSEQPVTIDVAGRRYQAELTGLSDAMAQLSQCEAEAG